MNEYQLRLLMLVIGSILINAYTFYATKKWWPGIVLVTGLTFWHMYFN